jgi:hypothetical protein
LLTGAKSAPITKKLRRMEAFLPYIASEVNSDDVDPEQAARGRSSRRWQSG